MDSLLVFCLAQIFGLIACVLAYIRMQKNTMRSLHIYHSILCIPLAFHFYMVGAIFAASLCVIGSLRTFLLATDWGHERKVKIVFFCLMIPTIGMIWTATHWLDWVLLFTTILGVGSEAQSSMFKLRVCALINSCVWILNSLIFGAYMGALLNLSSVVSNLKAMKPDFATLPNFILLRPAIRERLRPS